jgi:hypothetical protein
MVAAGICLGYAIKFANRSSIAGTLALALSIFPIIILAFGGVGFPYSVEILGPPVGSIDGTDLPSLIGLQRHFSSLRDLFKGVADGEVCSMYPSPAIHDFQNL